MAEFDSPEKQFAAVEGRLSALEGRLADLEAQSDKAETVPPVWLPLPPPPTGRLVPPVPEVRGLTPPEPLAPGPMPPPPAASQQPLQQSSPWADASSRVNGAPGVGQRPKGILNPEAVLKWSGFMLVSLAAVFLVSTAIERGWIGPELQLLGAVSAGLALIGIGVVDKLRAPWRLPAVGSGLVVLFASCGAAWDWLDLISPEVAGFAAVTVGALGLYLSHRSQAVSLAALSLAGLLLVPMWSDLHHSFAPSVVMSYLVVLSLAIALLYLVNRWVLLWSGTVLLFGFLAVSLASEVFNPGYASILDLSYSPTMAWLALIAAAMLASVQWLIPVAFGLGIESSTELEADADPDAVFAGHAVRLALVVPVWFLTFFRFALKGVESVPSGTFAIGSCVTALLCFGSAAAVSSATSKLAVPTRQFMRRLVMSQGMAGIIALAIASAASIDGVYLPLVLMAQGVAMLWFVDVLDDELFNLQALVLLVAGAFGGFWFTLVALVEDSSWAADVVLLGILALFSLSGWWLYQREALKDLAKVGLGVAYIWLFLWVSAVAIHWDQGQVWISGCWALFALATVAAGVRLASPSLLRLGLSALSVTIIKLLTVDLAAVDTFWRVGLFFLVGICLLAVGYRMPRLVELSMRSDSDAKAGQASEPTPGL